MSYGGNKSLKSKMDEMNRRIEFLLSHEANQKISEAFNIVFRNQGSEWAGVRKYETGDAFEDLNVRNSIKNGALSLIDTSSSIQDEIAAGRIVVNNHFKERRSCLFCVVDISDSLFYGISRDFDKLSIYTNKLYVFLKLFQIFYHVALRNFFKVGTVICSLQNEIIEPHYDYTGKKISLSKITQAAVRVWNGKQMRTDGSTRDTLRKTLENIYQLMRYRSVIVVFSDFNYSEKKFGGLTRIMNNLSQEHFVIPVWIRDRRELSISVLGHQCLANPAMMIPISGDEYLVNHKQGNKLYALREKTLKNYAKTMESSFLFPLIQTAWDDNIDEHVKLNVNNYFAEYINVTHFIKPS